MEKKLKKHGNSVVLVLDKALLKSLKMDESSTVNIIIKDNSLLITPTIKKTKTIKANNTLNAAKRLIKKHDTLFKKLSKT